VKEYGHLLQTILIFSKKYEAWSSALNKEKRKMLEAGKKKRILGIK